jgi:hypothetical protein
MLAKCSNPSCSASFRFLHSGKLFHFEHPHAGNGMNPAPLATKAEMFWLCEKCSAELTLVLDRERGIRTVPLSPRRLRAAS